MYSDIFEELNNLDENMLFEMANAIKSDTGLPYDIWLDSSGIFRNNKHVLPRIKVNVDNNLIPVLISDTPSIPISVVKKKGIDTFKKFNEISDFIIKYKDLLLKHWNGEISDREILNMLVKE